VFKKSIFYVMVGVGLLLVGCGLKVIDPNAPNNKGTLALDTSGGGLKLVETYTCKLDSMGKHYYAVGKTEDEARQEALAKCRDGAVLSFCKIENAKCEKN
jgi:hypothetical protein